MAGVSCKVEATSVKEKSLQGSARKLERVCLKSVIFRSLLNGCELRKFI
jgi:hypothetical protein